VKDTRGRFLRSLEESGRPREHWRGLDPEDGKTEWLFETVADDERRVAIRQLTVSPDEFLRLWRG
jgi:hypothetical protein